MFNTSYLINQFIISLSVILSIAFYTLLERKVLSYMQNRKGPNKISFSGIAQPASDALKLLTKKEFKLTFSNNLVYWLPPFYSFFMFILILNLMPNKNNLMEMSMGWMEFFCFIALLSISSIIMGWASNSKYTMLGSLRALSQSISYEVILIMSVIIFLIMINSMNIMSAFYEKYMVINMMLILFIIFFISLVCELNRAPFDLAEGESELVSGFNTEYGMTKFSLIFLSEYGMMIFMSIILVTLTNNWTQSFFFTKLLMIMTFLLWLRAAYPRMRYDLLMYLTWKNMLTVMLLLSIFLVLIL